MLGLMQRPATRGVLVAFVAAGIASLSYLSLADGRSFAEPTAPRSNPVGSLSADWPEPITPLSPVTRTRAELVELGARLFSDRRLSAGASRSCASCHQLEAGGDDGRRRGAGADGRPLLFNVPSILNAWKNYRYGWRGNFATLEEQNEAILLDPRVMGGSWPTIIRALSDDRDYVASFRTLFGQAPDRRGVLEALGAFQRSLTTQNGRFDRYLRGDEEAITEEEEQGYALFKSYGCISCHQGENVGGNLMQRFPLFPQGFGPAERDGGETERTANLGRYSITGKSADRYLFRVPSLRNVALTAPYFHDGRAAMLDDAVAEMAASQLGRTIPAGKVSLIVAFLKTLGGPDTTGAARGRADDPS
ncbi:cytochrome-c peroxidase [Aurantimonas sp. HBX-1]|uniref:cytochrome-c peroxidase n=1 Tax=Aurantimonas sp. HBX-1 TaxID=2906072 RepID=UPI001F45377A|nr:cytochrome c peroxidase [Aurantimonas sp. HBX-1]UIJ72584.1 c-type cytochrome [Aurantimonas sp. HBX-1]